MRRAIREERKLVIAYCDEQGRASERVIYPLAIVYFVEAINVAGWCELRQAFRHFRADRIRACALSGARFEGTGAELRARWLAARQSCRGGQPELPRALNSLSRLDAHETAVPVVVSNQGRKLIAALQREHVCKCLARAPWPR